MTDLGQVGAAAVTTIGTLAIVGTTAKVANSAIKNVGRMPKTKSGYRVMPRKKSYGRTKRSAKNFSIWK